jgi:cellobiose-specific phosphotransferase system component IIA
VLSSTGPTGFATSALQTAGNSILTTIDADTSILAASVTASKMQVDVIAALPAGSNAIGKLAANSGVDIGDVDVLSSALPSGAATSALQTTANGILTTIDADTSLLAGAIAGTEMQVDVLTSALPSGAATSALQTSSEALLTTIDADTSLLAGAVSGTEVQVDVLTSALPSGAATSALQTSGNSLLTTIDADTSLLAGAISGTEMQVDVLSLPADSKNYVWKEGLDSTIGGITNSILDTSTTNIPSGTQLTVATLANDVYEIQTVEDIGEFIGVYAGATLKAILPLGGGSVKINLPSTTVVKLASFSGTAIASGSIAINFLG